MNLKDCRLLVTPTSYRKNDPRLRTELKALVGKAALYNALLSGHLKGARLDAFTVEPPYHDNPQLRLPQVIATPHLGTQTDGATSNMGWFALRDYLAVLQNEEPVYRVV
jgi:phosphoglycerate dehydrogenase-like enzyme